MAYDIIGHIHRHAEKLKALLRTLGYHETAGAWRHPERKAIFVGDFIDRGPAQLPSVDIARRMVDAGVALAVMGNHELNAIACHTPDSKHPGISCDRISASNGETRTGNSTSLSLRK